MNKAEIQSTTLIEKGVSTMWADFEQSHSKLLADVLSQVKGSIHLTAEDIESIKAKLQFKLTTLIDDMG